MDIIVYLIPIALFLGGLGLVAFLWSLKSGQFDDLDGAAMRALRNDDGSLPGEKTSNDQSARNEKPSGP